ncbi:MAG: RNA 2',3'-cyclic phosphodiesterase [Candidatus Dormibacteraeota bacterium]|nr:RNA 2',3'-cyclic phosphodiesterase [Candidatus Dormibacteraeota bacterium]
MGADPLAQAAGLLSERPETVRAFLAVEIPDLQREALAVYLEGCRAAAPTFRWVSPESLHLTLRFLGPLDPHRLDALAGALRSVAVEPFLAGLDGLGTFGRSRAVRVVWLGLAAGSEELVRLAGEIEGRCAAHGFEPEARPYNPHLTLARSRQRGGDRLPELPQPPELTGWTVTRFRLYRSRLGRGGATYSVLEEFGG